MRHAASRCGAVVAVLVVLVADCGQQSRTQRESDRRTIAAAVDSATRAFEAAERAQDAAATIAHLAPDFYMYNDGVRVGYDSVVASVRRTMGSFQHFQPRFDDLEVRVLGAGAAFASFTFRDSIVTRDGGVLRFTGPTTLVWELQDAEWRIVYADADHYPVPLP